MNSFGDSPYSAHFNRLSYVGAWVFDTKNPILIKFFVMYRMIFTAIGVYGGFALVADFFSVFGNFKKMTWNLCVSVFYCGSLFKTFQLMKKINNINYLRYELYKAEQSRQEPDDVVEHKKALMQLKILRIYFYGAIALFVPMWLVTMYFSYMWGPRMLPVPMKLPVDINIENEFEYNVAFAILSLLGVVGITLVNEQEMSMFSIFIQISREYSLLLKDITKLNGVCKEKNRLGRRLQINTEFNPLLRQEKQRLIVKDLSIKQQKLIKYTEEFEFCYSGALLLQLFGVSLLVTLNALQLLLESGGLSGSFLFQMGFLAATTLDLFLMCWFATRISSQCLEVGEAAYDTLWYLMSSEVQKDIGMIIMRAQRPPKITCGKIMELNLNVFMHRVSNIYSWLALFRQLELKFNDKVEE